MTAEYVLAELLGENNRPRQGPAYQGKSDPLATRKTVKKHKQTKGEILSVVKEQNTRGNNM